MAFASIDEVRSRGISGRDPAALGAGTLLAATRQPAFSLTSEDLDRTPVRIEPAAWIAELAEAAVGARDTEERIHLALDLAVRHSGAETVAIVRRVGNGWSVVGLRGASPGPEVDAALDVLRGTAPFFVESWGVILLACPVRTGSAAGEAWMLVCPWPGSRAPSPELPLSASLCGS